MLTAWTDNRVVATHVQQIREADRSYVNIGRAIWRGRQGWVFSRILLQVRWFSRPPASTACHSQPHIRTVVGY